VGRCGLDSSGSEKRPVAGCYEPSSSIKGGEFLHLVNDCQLHKDCVALSSVSENGSLTLREEHRWKVFEKRELSRMFGPKREEVTRGQRKLHNEKLHSLYSIHSIIRVSWAAYVTQVGETKFKLGNRKGT
jgi:hypothetical protein